MPTIRSKSQLRWAHFAAKKKRGKTRLAAQKAIREFHGKTTRGMPNRIGTKPRKKRARKTVRY